MRGINLEVGREVYVNAWRTPISYAMLNEQFMLDRPTVKQQCWIDLAPYDWPYTGHPLRWAASVVSRRRAAPRVFRKKVEDLGVCHLRLRDLSPIGDPVDFDRQVLADFLVKSEYSAISGHAQTPLEEVPAYIHRGVSRSLGTVVPRLWELLEGASRVTVINGRTRVGAAVISAARAKGVDFRVLEVGFTPQYWVSWENCWPNARDVDRRRMLSVWESADGSEEVRRTAAAFLDSRLNNAPQQGWKFQPNVPSTAELEALIASRPPHLTRSVAFFPTTSIEMSLRLDSGESSGVWSQEVAFRALADACAARHVDLIVRVHPQPWGHRVREETAYWNSLAAPTRARVVAADSRISSYDLAKWASQSFVYESGIGPEISWLSKNVVVLGEPFWAQLFSDRIAHSRCEIDTALDQEQEPLPREAVLPWAYYLSTAGQPYRHVEVADYGTIKDDHGLIDQSSAVSRLLTWIRGSFLEPLLGTRRV